jgi:hypothetical protein
VRLIGIYPQGVLYLDLGSVSKTRSTAEGRMHMVLKTPAAVSREEGGYHWIARLTYRVEFDCAQPRSRILGTTMVDFSGQGVGTEAPAESWEASVPGTPGEGAREQACGERREVYGDLATIEDAMAVFYGVQAQENARGY